MIRISNLTTQIQSADWVITGEGRVDSQSLDGKVLSGVIQIAKAASVKVAVIAGSCELREEDLQKAGLAVALPANEEGLPLEEAIRRAAELAETAGRTFASNWL